MRSARVSTALRGGITVTGGITCFSRRMPTRCASPVRAWSCRDHLLVASGDQTSEILQSVTSLPFGLLLASRQGIQRVRRSLVESNLGLNG
jgi:hypothetical protein